MALGNAWRYASGGYDHERSTANALQRILGGAALGCIAVACAWTVCVNLAGDGAEPIEFTGGRGDKLELAGKRGDKLVSATRYALTKFGASVSLLDPHFSSGLPPRLFAGTAVNAATNAAADTATAETAALPSHDQSVATEPAKPTIRQAREILSTPPATHATTQSAASPVRQHPSPQIRTASLGDYPPADSAAETPAPKPSIFERIFGKPFRVALGYAAPDDSGLGSSRSSALGRSDSQTAVYDISAHTVYMPDGEKLEAHSGLGSMLDDPRHARVRNRGVTPPNVYDLELRERPFHGVRALRLIPVDDAKVFGRTGLLAHSFMLGPHGDSNGCVSFRNYEAFLRAYMNHEIKRLVVVAGQS